MKLLGDTYQSPSVKENSSLSPIGFEPDPFSVHQVWLGKQKPISISKRVQSICRWARHNRLTYVCWDRKMLKASLGDEFSFLYELFSLGESAALCRFLSDILPYYYLAEFGGLYVSANFASTSIWGKSTPPAGLWGWVPGPVDPQFLWAVGEEGKEEAVRLWQACKEHLHALKETLFSTAAGFIAELREAAGKDRLGQLGCGKDVLNEMLLKKAGVQVHPLGTNFISIEPDPMSHFLYLPPPEKQTDTDEVWDNLMEKAQELDRKKEEERKRMRAEYEARLAEQTALLSEAGYRLQIPKGTKRIVIFSNVTSIDLDTLKLGKGDHCIHLNRAMHYQEAISVPGTTHACLVRSGINERKDKKQLRWFNPSTTIGFGQIIYIEDSLFHRCPWWQAYKRENPKKCPTSGFLAWHMAMDSGAGLPVVLCGFAPGEDFGSYAYPGHAWEYERDAYASAGATIIRPLPDKVFSSTINVTYGTKMLVFSDDTATLTREAFAREGLMPPDEIPIASFPSISSGTDGLWRETFGFLSALNEMLKGNQQYTVLFSDHAYPRANAQEFLTRLLEKHPVPEDCGILCLGDFNGFSSYRGKQTLLLDKCDYPYTQLVPGTAENKGAFALVLYKRACVAFMKAIKMQSSVDMAISHIGEYCPYKAYSLFHTPIFLSHRGYGCGDLPEDTPYRTPEVYVECPEKMYEDFPLPPGYTLPEEKAPLS